MKQTKKNFENNPRFYHFLRVVFGGLFCLWYAPQIIGKENIPASGAAVLAGNHLNARDPLAVVVSTKRMIHSLAKKELFDNPFGWFFRKIGCIPVDRGAAHNHAALASAVDTLNDGKIVNLSPEGTRNRTDQPLLPFKIGAVIMAQRAHCQIIPYAVTGKFKFRSRDLKIVFGKPFEPSGMTAEEANRELFHRVLQLLPENRR